jgi:hypothetical protein
VAILGVMTAQILSGRSIGTSLAIEMEGYTAWSNEAKGTSTEFLVKFLVFLVQRRLLASYSPFFSFFPFPFLLFSIFNLKKPR